jgi:hypothetical protein
MDNENQIYFCPNCGIHYAVPVQALLNNSVILCEACDTPLLVLPDNNENPPIC